MISWRSYLEIAGRDDTDFNSTGGGTGNDGPQGTGLALSMPDHAQGLVGQKAHTFCFCSCWEWEVAMMKMWGTFSCPVSYFIIAIMESLLGNLRSQYQAISPKQRCNDPVLCTLMDSHRCLNAIPSRISQCSFHQREMVFLSIQSYV